MTHDTITEQEDIKVKDTVCIKTGERSPKHSVIKANNSLL
jgi:hypothetical protein